MNINSAERKRGNKDCEIPQGQTDRNMILNNVENGNKITIVLIKVSEDHAHEYRYSVAKWGIKFTQQKD